MEYFHHSYLTGYGSGMHNSSFVFAKKDVECESIHSVNSSYKCDFVKSTPDCYIQEGIVEYTIFLYCEFIPSLLPLSITLLVLWLSFLFVALAVAADNFFCPSLVVIARVLRMSDNIAIYGITLLAFGNGAPDVFSAISAVQNMKHGDEGLVFGALLGAGVFLTTVVVGAVTIVKPFESMQRPFLRDIIFYIVTVFFTFYVCYDKIITIYEAVGYIIGYVVYVIVVIAGRLINKYINRTTVENFQREIVAGEPDNEIESVSSYNYCVHGQRASRAPIHILYVGERSPVEDGPASQINTTPPTGRDATLPQFQDSEETPLLGVPSSDSASNTSDWYNFLCAISPVDIYQWRDGSRLSRMSAIFKAPALFIFKITVPVVDDCYDKQNWNRHLNTLHCIITPIFCIFAADVQVAMTQLGGRFPVWAIFLICSVILAIVVFLTSKSDNPPVYHAVFAFVGFFAAVMWIKTIASEIVNLLQTLGIIFGISNAILGLTLLAWGNSIGDFISDVSMAMRGYPRAGFSACFGGPLFNTLLGIGIPFTMATLKAPSHVLTIQFVPIQLILFVGLTVSLVSSLVVIPLSGFKLRRSYGVYLILVYVVFLTVAILVERKVFHMQLDY